MKKTLILILALGMCCCILFACKTETLPMPDYPLDADTIDNEFKVWGHACTIQEDESVNKTRPEQTFYSLFSVENGELVAAVSSGHKDGERVLVVSFTSCFSTNAIPAQQSEGAFALATRLFGGFESEQQVYDSFIQEYDTVNTEKKQRESSIYNRIPMREGESTWRSNVGGTDCRIIFEQPKLDEPQEYLVYMVFASDWDTFFSE